MIGLFYLTLLFNTYLRRSLILPDPLHLPFDNDLNQLHHQLPVVQGGVWRVAKSLDGIYHCLDEVVPHWVVHLVVPHKQLPAKNQINIYIFKYTKRRE